MRWRAERGRGVEGPRLLVVAVAAASFLAAAGAMAGQNQPTDAAPQSGPHLAQRPAEVAASPGRGGMLIYRDPETGAFTVPPPEIARDLAPAPVAAGRSAAVNEVPGGTAAGGTKIDLRGQWFTVIEKSRPGGELSARCTGPVDGVDR
jgi:hypothetical protein